ncbi:MAG: N-acetylmuramoyl-L-alanine amidase [Deltaproteobacteria bacterium]|nr:N-acetylmuramoyl-L-alanine amidase [Deltaproteobacteria bacterium]
MIKGLCFKSVILILLLSQAALAEGPVIVIDPGHGGKDPGTLALKGFPEKKLALSIARQLKKSLVKKAGGAQVFLTRNRDTYLGLEKRNRIANSRQCDLFLSLHANAAENRKADGVEIYYLNKATDAASRRLAARENRGSKRREKDEEAILSDLIQTAATEESAELAGFLKKSLSKTLRKEGVSGVRVKTALFYVLVGAKCPGLLIETGYLTNVSEAKRLKDKKFQERFAEALADGIQRYFARHGQTRRDL